MRSTETIKGAVDVLLVGVMTWTLAVLVGCGSSTKGGGTVTPPPETGAKAVYVISDTANGTGGSILKFGVGSEGNVAPQATLLPPSELQVVSVATDDSGQIYVGGYADPNWEILVYPAGSTGSATPTRTLLLGTFETTNFVIPGSMTIDAEGVLYVAGPGGNVAVFSATANGSGAPTQLITSSILTGPVGVAVDSSGNMYVSNEVATNNVSTGAIYVFAKGATGNATPIREITSPNVFFGIALDASGNIYATEDTYTTDTSGDVTAVTAQLVEFAGTATGDATPIKSVEIPSGGAPFTVAAGLRIDSAGYAYLAAQTASGAAASDIVSTSVLEYSPDWYSGSNPAFNFTSSSWVYPQEQIAIF